MNKNNIKKISFQNILQMISPLGYAPDLTNIIEEYMKEIPPEIDIHIPMPSYRNISSDMTLPTTSLKYNHINITFNISQN